MVNGRFTWSPPFSHQRLDFILFEDSQVTLPTSPTVWGHSPMFLSFRTTKAFLRLRGHAFCIFSLPLTFLYLPEGLHSVVFQQTLQCPGVHTQVTLQDMQCQGELTQTCNATTFFCCLIQKYFHDNMYKNIFVFPWHLFLLHLSMLLWEAYEWNRNWRESQKVDPIVLEIGGGACFLLQTFKAPKRIRSCPCACVWITYSIVLECCSTVLYQVKQNPL